ncbi:MAG: glycosyltransferase family 2 protein [Endomicrobia bacterium]|nr:glycosyltransferase family 2 protein [Endomicrobiia bacterium]
MKSVKKFFSAENDGKVKILTIFGIKLKIRKKIKFSKDDYAILKKYCRMKRLRTINKDLILSKFENMKESGVLPQTQQRTPKLIVSLTSYPERMYDIHYCLYSILSQTVKPDKVILWLAEEQFPAKEKDIPKKVIYLKDFGLDIKWTDDLKSYKKLIPALKEHPDDVIVTADDDIFYESEWLEKLYKYYDGKNILCHRAHKIVFDGNKVAAYRKWKHCIEGTEEASFFNFFVGCGGVLYPPRVLYKDVLKKDLFMQLSPAADDLWFWAMAVLNNTGIKAVNDNIRDMTYINVEREANMNDEQTLHQINYAEGNDRQITALFKHYPEILKRIQSEDK